MAADMAKMASMAHHAGRADGRGERADQQGAKRNAAEDEQSLAGGNPAEPGQRDARLAEAGENDVAAG
jgi:hypothetical protein